MEGKCWEETFLYVADAEQAAVDESRCSNGAVVDVTIGQNWGPDDGIPKGTVGQRAVGECGVCPDLKSCVRRCQLHLGANLRRHDVEWGGYWEKLEALMLVGKVVLSRIQFEGVFEWEMARRWNILSMQTLRAEFGAEFVTGLNLLNLWEQIYLKAVDEGFEAQLRSQHI
jgi:hypothetical protein